ncbi:ATP-grasp domain-containing protein [Streptomyces sp. NPDC017056]|uniref:ATP-grasp domain-containing protein n=1 Tax=Streptomyces sp. NPDC017056 TaxID=3364973 RepID=UPI0037A91587
MAPDETRAVLVVGCTSASAHGQDQLRRLAAQAASRNVRLVGADSPDVLKTDVWRMPAHETVAVDLAAPDALAAFAASRPGLAAVLTVKEGGVLPTALLARELGVAGNDPRAVRTIRNKDMARAVLRDAGFRQPECTVAAGEAEARAFLAGRAGRGPWIVKPRDGMGSAGVSLVETPRDLPAAVGALGADVPFLVEEFVRGEEFSAEGVVIGGSTYILGVTRKQTGPGFVETGHRMPAGLDAATEATARADVARAVSAVGVTHGIVHVEFWVTPEHEVVLGELHARPGGDFVHALVEHTRPGFELYGALLDDLLGERPPPVPAPSRAAGSQFLVFGPGRVTAVEGWERAAATEGLIAARLDVAPGDVLGPVRSSADRHGVLVAGADGPDEVDAVLAEAQKALHVALGNG